MIGSLRILLTGGAFVASLAGCAGGASTNYSGASALLPTQAETLQANTTTSKAKAGTSLYVSEQGDPNMIEVFGTNGSGPNRTIKKSLKQGPRGLAFDSASNLYVAMPGNGSPGAGAVNEYAYGTSNILRTMKVAGALELAVDASDNLYVLGGNGVYIFAPGSTVPSLSITAGIDLPVHMVLDSSNNIYVENCVNGNSSVTVYSPSGTLTRTITQGVYLPRALAVDETGNVYVGNESKSVAVYQAGSTKVWKTISGLKGDIVSLALDAHQEVYVGTTDNDAVSIFEAAPKFASKRVITSSISLPLSLAFDAQGDLFVANSLGMSVTKYLPGTTVPDKLMSTDQAPFFIAVGR
jgi:hypothetical protein